MRVALVSSTSTRSPRDRRKSLNDLKPKAFSLKDGSIRFIWPLTAELCSHSASSFSWPIRRARSSKPVAAAWVSAGAGSSWDLVQLFPAATHGKNGTDIRLSVDAVEDMFRLPDLT